MTTFLIVFVIIIIGNIIEDYIYNKIGKIEKKELNKIKNEHKSTS
jgi:hypothetical protein